MQVGDTSAALAMFEQNLVDSHGQGMFDQTTIKQEKLSKRVPPNDNPAARSYALSALQTCDYHHEINGV